MSNEVKATVEATEPATKAQRRERIAAKAKAKASDKAKPATGAKAQAATKGKAVASDGKAKGLSAKQRAVLAYLAAAKGWVGKAKVWYDCSAGTSVLGAYSRDEFGVQNGGGMLALGLVEGCYNDGSADGKGRVAYRITAKGKAAIK